jgi:CxxC motif-containing protein
MNFDYFKIDLEQLDNLNNKRSVVEEDIYLPKKDFYEYLSANNKDSSDEIQIQVKEDNYDEGNILESCGTMKNGKLLVQLASYKSEKIIGLYSNPHFISKELLQKVLVKEPVEIGDLIMCSEIKGIGQKQDDNIIYSYTVGKVITVPKLQGNIFECLCKLKI